MANTKQYEEAPVLQDTEKGVSVIEQIHQDISKCVALLEKLNQQSTPLPHPHAYIRFEPMGYIVEHNNA